MTATESQLFSYVLRYDTGFAPHVFNGACTLATCKPQIRRAACREDWIVGTSSARYSESPRRLVYLMQITEEPIPFEIYDQTHPERRPSFENPRGDNIYFFDAVAGAFEQRPNASHGRERWYAISAAKWFSFLVDSSILATRCPKCLMISTSSNVVRASGVISRGRRSAD